jgi:hypothetical protein
MLEVFGNGGGTAGGGGFGLDGQVEGLGGGSTNGWIGGFGEIAGRLEGAAIFGNGEHAIKRLRNEC